MTRSEAAVAIAGRTIACSACTEPTMTFGRRSRGGRRGVELGRRTIVHVPEVRAREETGCPGRGCRSERSRAALRTREVSGSLLDTILDRRVVAGSTSAGYRIRRHTLAADDLRMDGETALVTGATSGRGLAAAEGFARLRGERALAAVLKVTGNRNVQVRLCDDVRAFAARLTADERRLDVLVNDAGVLPAVRAVSADSNELTLATNVLGPFLLTNLLIPLLTESAPARVVIVSSGWMYTQRLHVEDLQTTGEDFDGPTVYARTERAQVIPSELWAKRLAGTGLVVHAMHPGWADTPGVASSLPRFHRLTGPLLRSPGQGADTIVWLGAAAGPAESSGGFWHDRRQRPTHRVPWTRETPEDRERLWRECERLTGWHAVRVPAPTHAPASERG